MFIRAFVNEAPAIRATGIQDECTIKVSMPGRPHCIPVSPIDRLVWDANDVAVDTSCSSALCGEVGHSAAPLTELPAAR